MVVCFNNNQILGSNHEGGLHFRDNRVSKIPKNIFSAELIIFFGRKILFSAELFFGRKRKRQIERCNNSPLDLRVQIWSDGYFFSGNNVSAEQSFGRKIVRPNNCSAELCSAYLSKKCLYITDTSAVECFSQIWEVVGVAVLVGAASVGRSRAGSPLVGAEQGRRWSEPSRVTVGRSASVGRRWSSLRARR
jgi:hypothetical protein